MDIKQLFLDGHKITNISWRKQEFILLDKEGIVRDEDNKPWCSREGVLERITSLNGWELFQETIKTHDLWI